MKNYLTNTEAAMCDAIATAGLVPPSRIDLDGKPHQFDGRRFGGKREDCWYSAHNKPIPILVGSDNVSGVSFQYIHASLPISYTERVLIDERLLEMHSEQGVAA